MSSTSPRDPVPAVPVQADVRTPEEGRIESTMTPEAIQDVLEARRRNLARPNRDPRESAEGDPMLIFSLAGERYALAARRVWGVERLPELTPVPGSPEAIVGITNLRSVLVPVVDLRRILALDTCGLSDMSRLVLVGRDRHDFGLLADSVDALQHVAAAQILPLPDSSTWLRHCVLGMTSDGIVVLDADAVIDNDRLRAGPSSQESPQEHTA